MRLVARIGGIVSLLIPLTVLANGGWSELGGSASGGGISNTPDSSRGTAIALDGLGRPVAAWKDMSSGRAQAYLKRWNGSAWVELGGSASGGGVSNTPEGSIGDLAMAIDGAGNPIVAWAADREIRLLRWNGSAWVGQGGSGSGGGVSGTLGGSSEPSLALDAAGNPIVAWSETAADPLAESEIYLKHWVP